VATDAARPCRRPPALDHRHPNPRWTSDLELGVVVAADWTLDERLVEATTLLELHADESAAAQTFRFEPPSGVNLTEGTLSPIPTRFKPAFAVGILTAVASEHVARLLSRLPSRFRA